MTARQISRACVSGTARAGSMGPQGSRIRARGPHDSGGLKFEYKSVNSSEDMGEVEAENDQTFVVDGFLDRKGRVAVRERTGGWRAAPLIFATEICERLATLGLQRNLVTYLVDNMHLSKVKAANTVSNFVGTNYFTPFIGGFAADAYLGRFWAISSFASVQTVGMTVLTLSATLPSLRPASCPSEMSVTCKPAHGLQMAIFLVGLYLIALGNGGIKSNVSALGADQFDSEDAKEKQHLAHFFNWFYFFISVGSLISVTLFVYIQDNIGFGWGFGIPSGIMIIGILLFVAGASLYRYKAPAGSPLTRIAQVLVAAVRKFRFSLPLDDTLLYHGDATDLQSSKAPLHHTKQFKFLDKAAVVVKTHVYDDEPPSRWQLCSVTQVEELKLIVRVLPIWLSTITVWAALGQLETFSVEAASTLDNNMGPHFKFPPATLSVFELLNVIFFLPLYDRYFVPFARRFTGYEHGITTLQRIGTGMIFATLCMVVAAVVEVKRVNVAKEHGLLDKPDVMIPMSIFWLVPQYSLRGITEIFTQVGQLEFFYNEAPDGMRSLGTAIYLSTIGAGHYLSTLLVTLVTRVTSKGDDPGWLANNLNRSRLDYFYSFLAVLSFLNFFFYLLCAHWYRYKPVRQDSASEEVTHSDQPLREQAESETVSSLP